MADNSPQSFLSGRWGFALKEPKIIAHFELNLNQLCPSFIVCLQNASAERVATRKLICLSFAMKIQLRVNIMS
jgi:hypothetical protein